MSRFEEDREHSFENEHVHPGDDGLVLSEGDVPRQLDRAPGSALPEDWQGEAPGGSEKPESGAREARLLSAATGGVLASVVGALYYLRVVMQMYVRDPAGEEGPAPLRPSEALAIFAAAAATLWIGFFPSFLLALAQRLA